MAASLLPKEPDQALLQVRDLAPLSVRGDEMAVPILSAAEGIGERRVLEDVHSDINGCTPPILHECCPGVHTPYE